MPPKPKFTKEEIVAAALELVSEKGMEALTSRDLGARLGSSARPIFTVFSSMEEVQQAVRKAALVRFEEFAEKAVHYKPAFKQFGMQMILFARSEPKLYQLIWMSENREARSFDDVFPELGEVATVCVDVISRDYGLCYEEAMALFKQVWIFTFGIGAMCAAKVCHFSFEEINRLLGLEFMSMLMFIKSGRLNQPTPVPKPYESISSAPEEILGGGA
ncbi:MAG: TetR/AcrR family transcriptional regulator [Oscillospiraceae bacterium]|nr:TetR/AcrR family transcriptional regulator [Oscillospiraceae bacterium]